MPEYRTTFEIKSIPDKGIDAAMFLDAMGSEAFSLVYDFSSRSTRLVISGETPNAYATALEHSIPGLKLSVSDIQNRYDIVNCTAILAYRKSDTFDVNTLSDVFDMPLSEGFLAIAFAPVGVSAISESKSYIEETLSRRNTRETVSVLSDIMSRRINASLQTENFNGSEEAMLLTDILESINVSLLRNGHAYKVYFITNDASCAVEKYIHTRFLVLSKTRIPDHAQPLSYCLKKIRSFPVGFETARKLINIRGPTPFNYVLKTVVPCTDGDIEIGTFMKDGVLDTGSPMKTKRSALNLGFIITGLPGAGKTNEAMAIVHELLSKEDSGGPGGSKGLAAPPMVAIISPTNEWSSFADSHGIYTVKLYDGCTPINFFRCPEELSAEKFYECLALILSSASNAGPYRNPMEKCMLNAFRKIYGTTKNPDPVSVYEQIEESVAEFHAKKTNTGKKYTKHGENIRSALENLRAILARNEYSSRDGIKIGDMLRYGIVFDLSEVSASAKPYLYALILNQIYALGSNFDTKGDNELRLLICLEEAQLIFKEKDSTAVQDLKYRIQDFRKQGIGLMLLTHNVSDIDPSIRRLCQLKLYLKQAPDVAPIAEKDLVFTLEDEDAVVQKLKHLDSRVGALSYVVKSGADKISQDTIFMRTKDYRNGLQSAAGNHKTECLMAQNNIKVPETIDAVLDVSLIADEKSAGKGSLVPACRLALSYLGERIYEFELHGGGNKLKCRLIRGKGYNAELRDSRGRILRSFRFDASDMVTIAISVAGIYIK